MILIDALYINNSGGKILLDYLIEEIEQRKLKVHYLLDDRIVGKHPVISDNSVTFVRANLMKRHQFYKENKLNFTKILCFGNLPPTLKTKAVVYTYFHQKLFLEIPSNTHIKSKIIFKMKAAVLNLLKVKTDFWIVQTDAMKQLLIHKLQFGSAVQVLTIPFYPSLEIAKKTTNAKYNYVYVSAGTHHKNHIKLIDAYQIFYGSSDKKSELHLTIGDEFGILQDYIKEKVNLGFPIINHGFVNRNALKEIYSKASFMIYPSLSESFGLGIVEAIESGCEVIGADLPYMHEVCEPSLCFDPNNVDDIVAVLKSSVSGKFKPTKQKIHNQLKDLLQLLN